MVINRYTKILVVLCIVYFQAMIMSHLFFYLGTASEIGNKRKLLKMSHYFMPLDHYPSYEYAYTYLDVGAEKLDRELLTQGIEWFKTSLSINPFYFYSHYYLGKAYYFYHYPTDDFFDDTFASFKKTAFLNDHDPDIVADISKIVLSMWPHLEAKDRLMCLDLLKNTIDRVNDQDFKTIIEFWSLYSRDPEVLRVILKNEKELYGKAARILAGAGGSLPLRWELLAGYEQFLFEEVGNRMKRLSFAPNVTEMELAELIESLDKIVGYWRLAGGRWSPGAEFYDLSAELMIRHMKAFLADQKKTLTVRGRKKLSGLAARYLETINDYKNLEAFRVLLDQHNYFDTNDIESIYIKFLLEYRQGNYSKLISHIEEFKGQITMVNGQKRRDYLKVLLLLSDSLEASKLLSVASDTIYEMLKLFPSEPSVAWRLLKVHHIIGDVQGEAILAADLVENVKNSRIVHLDSRSLSRRVYFLDDSELSISLSSTLASSLGRNALMRVFVDDAVVWEVYVRDVTGAYKLKIPGKEYSSIELRIDSLVFRNSPML